MKKNAIIVHGICDREEYYEMNYPSPSNFHWIPWLQQQLLRNDILCQTPEMPAPYSPTYEEWKETFEQFKLTNETIYIGHSAGCGFILKWLNENREKGVKFKKLIMVAPWLDPNKDKGDFLEFDFDFDINDVAEEIHLFCSDDDMDDVIKTRDIILDKSEIIKYYHYVDKGHFCFSNVGANFENLLKVCLD